MTELMVAARQHQTRPDDERACSLLELGAMARNARQNSRRAVITNRAVRVMPSTTDPFGIAATATSDRGTIVGEFSHWSFGQLSSQVGAPASYLRELPGAVAADCLNWGLGAPHPVEELSVLVRRENGVDGSDPHYRFGAFNGPAYGVVWDADIIDALIDKFGDGVSGKFRIPGDFGVRHETITKENTTLYRGDRDCWGFLADEDNKIQIDNRRNGEPGALSRGFYFGNSEVGAKFLTFGCFLYDYKCCNHIIWGVTQFKEVKIRHSKGAPLRWHEEVVPVLDILANAPLMPIDAAIKAAQARKIDRDVNEFLAGRFGASAAIGIAAAHMAEEARPIETLWDATVGATAYAKRLQFADARVDVEREAGKLLALAA